ncbi:MAG TPA: SDR family NAD(P)-dependent oxidoreductase, partial [Planococcus sp. (in: firmicutes)]|nr:SDR family NAD(P)-dependent oxidoreductase [Planococcus sp. (in: firmicutes)]
MDLAGKVAVITGGASGIGLAAAKAYLAKGAKVVIADFNEEGGKQAAEDLKNDGEIAFVKVDVSNEEEVKNMIDFAVDQFGSIDVLVNNAGIGALTE